MDRKAAIDRVMQLVRLAGSSFEEEARTSAHLACKLIREHGLTVRGPRDEEPERAREARPDPPPPPPEHAYGPGWWQASANHPRYRGW